MDTEELLELWGERANKYTTTKGRHQEFEPLFSDFRDMYWRGYWRGYWSGRNIRKELGPTTKGTVGVFAMGFVIGVAMNLVF